MWTNNERFEFAEFDNGTGNSGFGLAHGPRIDLKPELPQTTPDLIGVDLTHRIDVSDIAGGGAAAKGGGGGGSGGGKGGGGSGETTSFAPYTSGAAGGYNITIEFKGSWTQAFYDIFKAAADRLSAIIAQDIPDVLVVMKGLRTVDDILITAELGKIDGEGGVLGQAGPTSIRTDGYLPATAVMKFDIADAEVFRGLDLFDDIVLHEMLHALGFGSIWGYKNLVSGGLYTGEAALAEYVAMLGASAPGVPVETDGGSGTAGSHWDEETFINELMTGFINAGANYLSAMSVAALADLGYGLASTNYALYADAGYTFPA